MSMLNIQGLTAGYGPVAVLHGIDMEVGEGELVVVLGANGAGKTTTMRAISGLIPRQGVIEMEGRNLTKASPDAVVRVAVVVTGGSDSGVSRVGMEAECVRAGGDSHAPRFCCRITPGRAGAVVSRDLSEGLDLGDVRVALRDANPRRRQTSARVQPQVWASQEVRARQAEGRDDARRADCRRRDAAGNCGGGTGTGTTSGDAGK